LSVGHVGPVGKHREYYKGEGGGFPPSLSHGESYESVFTRGLSVHQKCSNYASTNLLFGLCKFVWIIDPLVTCCNPHPKVPTRPYTPKMLQAKECAPTPYPSIVFTFGFVVEFIKELGGESILLLKKTICFNYKRISIYLTWNNQF